MRKMFRLIFTIILVLCASGCGDSGNDGLRMQEREFTQLSVEGSKTFKAGFGSDEVLDIKVCGDVVYYLAKKADTAGDVVSLCAYDMAEAKRETLFTQEDYGACGKLRITETAAFWAKSTDAGISLWKYDFAGQTAADTGVRMNVGVLEDVAYEAWMDQVYCFCEEGLAMWNGKEWVTIAAGAEAPETFLMENGKFGALDVETGNDIILLFDAETASIMETLDVSSIGLSSLVQANEFYAVWMNDSNEICVYDYENGDAFCLRNAGEEGWEIPLYGKYLVYKGAQNPLAWYDLENSQYFELNTDVSMVKVLGADAAGIWRDLKTANELIVIK